MFSVSTYIDYTTGAMLLKHNLPELNYKVIKSILTCNISHKNLSDVVMRQTDQVVYEHSFEFLIPA